MEGDRQGHCRLLRGGQSGGALRSGSIIPDRRPTEVERKAKEAVRTFSMLQGMFDLKVLLLALNYFGIVVASLGILFFVPQIIKSIGVTDNMTVGWLTMIPYISGGVRLLASVLVSHRITPRPR